jgi:hypothetical protein
MPASEAELTAIIRDASLTTAQRKDAAVYYVRMMVAAVPAPADDDPDVVALQQPWPRDSEQQRTIADMFAAATDGRSVHGYSPKDARAAVLAKRKRQRLAQLAGDASEDALIRDAAALELSGPAIMRA